MPFHRIGNGVVAIVLGAALVFAMNFAVAKRLVWTPGGFALSFGRMLQDGIVKKYLDEHCPDSKLKLCLYKEQLPNDADVWFWGSPLFDKLGRFAGLGDEMQTITINSILAYPALQVRTASIATIKQLIAVRTGEGVVNRIWHTYGIIERYAPRLVPLMRQARQQRGATLFVAINWVQYPVALIAMACYRLLSSSPTVRKYQMPVNWPPPADWRSLRMLLSVARYQTRMIVMARGWFGLLCSPASSHSCVWPAGTDYAAT